MNTFIRKTLLSFELEYPIERKKDIFKELFDDATSMSEVIFLCKEYKEEIENYRYWEAGFCRDIWIKDPIFYIDYFFGHFSEVPKENTGETVLWIGLEMFVEDLINDLYKNLLKWRENNETHLQ